MRLSSVLLPQPDAPSRHTNSPGSTSSVTPSSATTRWLPVPNDLVTSATDTTGRAAPRSRWVHRARGEQRALVGTRFHGVIVGLPCAVSILLSSVRS